MDLDSRCPLCGANLEYEKDGEAYSHVIGVEIRGVYDGVLFWQCPFCDGRWHRFSQIDRRWEIAERHVNPRRRES